MKAIGVLVLSIFSTGLFAQHSAIEKLFDKYGGQDGFTTVVVNKDLFDIVAQLDPDDEDLQKLSGKLEGIKILALDDEAQSSRLNFFEELENDLDLTGFKELLVVKEKGQDVKMLVREESGKIIEFLLIAGGNDNALIHITGDIDLQSLSGLSSSMDMDHLALLRKLEE